MLKLNNSNITGRMQDFVGRAWANTRTKHGTVECTWPSSECDCEFRPRISWHKKYKHMHNTGSVS